MSGDTLRLKELLDAIKAACPSTTINLNIGRLVVHLPKNDPAPMPPVSA